MGNNGKTNPVRLVINLVKVFGVVVTISIFLYLSHFRLLDGVSTTHWTLVAMLALSACAAVVDVQLESLDIPRVIVWLLVLVSLLFLGADVLDGYLRGWSRGERSWVLFLAGMMFIFINVLLSANDAEMEGFASEYFYFRHERRNGRFLAHLAFNVLPYTSVGLTALIMNVFGEQPAIWCAVGAIVILLTLIGTDEISRLERHRSFFWHNKPVYVP